MTAPARYDALVIGAGLSGLAAGIRLAQFDQRVCVLERHYLWGGLNSYYKQAGRRVDTGLHAMTNYVTRGVGGAPLTRVLRQLRLSWSDLELGQQSHSEIAFPDFTLRFSNDFELVRSEIRRVFPARLDAFDRMVAELSGYDDVFGRKGPSGDARARLTAFLTDRQLVDALLLPICYYGSARPSREDAQGVDWDTFCVLFRSIFLEGFCRPENGIKRVLDLLLARLKDAGGELRTRAGVAELVVDETSSRVLGVRLDDGTELEADLVLSSAGWAETMRLAGRSVPTADVGRLTFFETISFLDALPRDLGHEATVTFFNDADELRYDEPREAIDPTSGVICCPNNYERMDSPEGVLRSTCLARFDSWTGLDDDAYQAQKAAAADTLRAHAARHAFDPRPHTVHFDAFTPRTLRHYTGHLNGAVYGTPNKRADGLTGLDGLALCGTDQGMCGIVGAMLSGITMANRHALTPRLAR